MLDSVFPSLSPMLPGLEEPVVPGAPPVVWRLKPGAWPVVLPLVCRLEERSSSLVTFGEGCPPAQEAAFSDRVWNGDPSLTVACVVKCWISLSSDAAIYVCVCMCTVQSEKTVHVGYTAMGPSAAWLCAAC